MNFHLREKGKGHTLSQDPRHQRHRPQMRGFRISEGAVVVGLGNSFYSSSKGNKRNQRVVTPVSNSKRKRKEIHRTRNS